MLRELGATHVIVGHSERRTGHGESDEIVAGQARTAQKAGLIPIICIGETLEERSAGQTLNIIKGQLSGSLAGLESAANLVIAYEPLWAIGTGKVATPAQIEEVHGFIRSFLKGRFGDAGKGVRILYGGSLNPGNAPEILPIPNVDGGLIGGASLKAADFLAIYATARALSV
jgi:triosephosphate isomerase